MRSKHTVIHGIVPLALLGAWALALRGLRLDDVDDVGLVSAMPAVALVALGLLSVSFALVLARRPVPGAVALLHVLVLVVALYGVTAFVEPLPRFASVYRHVGIIDHIARHHAVDPGIDAYFNWPGFFTLGVLFNDVAGFDSAGSYAAWGSLVFNLLFLPPLLVIFRWASDDPRVRWAAVWAFFSCNWVGQDYLSPQAVGFLLWLAMLGALLVAFVPRTARLPAAPSLRAIPRAFGPGALRAVTADGPQGAPVERAGLLLLVVVIFGATVAGHQLTPFPALLATGALAVLAGLETRVLPLIMAIVMAAWISYMTTHYLSGHIETLAEPLGSVTQNLGQNVTGRLEGSSGHQFILHIRLAVTASIWLLAAAGFARRIRTGRADLALVLIAVTPFLLPVFQPYGGEMLLRVFLFALPAVALFIAYLAFPAPDAGRGRWTTVAVAATGCLLLAGFQYTRYGNERLDIFTPSEASAISALYRLAPPGSTLFAGSGNLPWRYRGYADYDYATIDQLDSWTDPVRPDPSIVLAEIRSRLGTGGGYVILTRSNQIDAELVQGKPGSLAALARELRASPSARELYRVRDGEIFFVVGSGEAEG